MVAAGILAALIILFSPTFQREANSFLSKAKTTSESTEETHKKLITVPSDAVTSSQAVTTESVKPFVVQEVIVEVGPRPVQLSPGTLITSLFKVLLRTVISPQAP